MTQNYKSIKSQQIPELMDGVSGRRWTSEEDEILTRLYNSQRTEETAKNLDRSKQAISARAHKLGLHKSRQFYKPVRWNEENINKFKKLYPSTDNQELAKIFGLSISALVGLATKFKVKKLNREFWTVEKIELLKELYPTTDNREIAEILGTTRLVICEKARTLNIKKPTDYKRKPYNNLYEIGDVVTLKDCQKIKLWDRSPYFQNFAVYLKREFNIQVPFLHWVRFKDGNCRNLSRNNLEFVYKHDLINEVRFSDYPSEMKPGIDALTELEEAIRKSQISYNCRFTSEEDQILRNEFEATPNSILAKKLGRKINAIKRRASLLGLVKAWKCRKRSSRDWTDEETNELIRLYPLTPTYELMKKFGRTRLQITSRAGYLGIRKPNIKPRKVWTDEEIHKFKNLYGKVENSELAKLFGTKKDAIKYQAQKLNLSRKYKTKNNKGGLNNA